jgi:hypothetical protein
MTAQFSIRKGSPKMPSPGIGKSESTIKNSNLKLFFSTSTSNHVDPIIWVISLVMPCSCYFLFVSINISFFN